MPYNLRKRKQPEPTEPIKELSSNVEPKKKRKVKSEATELNITNDKEIPPAKKIPYDEDEKVVTKKPKVPASKKVNDKKSIKKELVKIPKQEPVTALEPAPLTARLLTFGADSCGELGLGKIGISRKLPCEVPLEGTIKQVACGPMHTISLDCDGKVYSCGCNDEGALGRETDGDEILEATPTLVPLDNKVIKITAGDSHSAALTEKDEVYIWGNFRDEHGSIGLTPLCDGKATIKPLQIMPKLRLKDIASGSNHMLLLDVDGTVYSFGVGAQGQLGRLKPEEIGEDGKVTYDITAQNRELFLTPKKVSLKDVDPQRPFVCDAIYAGNFSSFATNTDKKKNRLAGWGLNNYHQLGYKGTKGQLVQHYPRRTGFTCSTTIINVACGQHHTLFLTRTGRVYSAGRFEYGMLGIAGVKQNTDTVCPPKLIEPLGNSIIDISAGINTSFAVSDEGKLYSWGMGGINLGLQGDDDLKVPTEVTSLGGKKVIAVSAGGSFTSILAEQ